MDYALNVPDAIASELEDPDLSLLVKRGLEIEELPSVEPVDRMCSLYREAHVPDLYALVLALHLDAPLVTQDAPLVAAAQNEGAVVLDTLWLLDQMVVAEIVDPATAADAVDTLLNYGRPLDKRKCAQKQDAWRKQASSA